MLIILHRIDDVSTIDIVHRLQEADTGFVLLVDRRKDKWSSAKTILFRIAVSISDFLGAYQSFLAIFKYKLYVVSSSMFVTI